jgi:site-specific DNA-methyltransferase (adenine-specific)
MIELYNGDCLEVMKHIEDNYIDNLVTDPPYGLSFMGKKWDYDVPSVDVWEECLRVLKPGGTALIFAGSRTQHRMAVNVEDAGFILKDTIEYFLESNVQAFYRTLDQQQKKDFLSLMGGNTMFWTYGSGFPKSLDISKAVDGLVQNGRSDSISLKKVNHERPGDVTIRKGTTNGHKGFVGSEVEGNTEKRNTPATKEGEQWSGYGTALKPSYEPIIIAMKPNDGTYANNALKHGVAGLNIDGCRVEGPPPNPRNAMKKIIRGGKFHAASEAEKEMSNYNPTQGRFPANIIHDGSEEVVSLFPKKAGASSPVKGTENSDPIRNSYNEYGRVAGKYHNDSGSAARFFYCAKASKAERNLGMNSRKETLVKNGENYRKRENADWQKVNGNFHPTVKPLALMEYLCKLVKTPTGGITLDPFMGSGTTGIACKNIDSGFIGIERKPEYFKIAETRINGEIQKEIEEEPEENNLNEPYQMSF